VASYEQGTVYGRILHSHTRGYDADVEMTLAHAPLAREACPPPLFLINPSAPDVAGHGAEREVFLDKLLVRILLIIEMILEDRPCAMGFGAEIGQRGGDEIYGAKTPRTRFPSLCQVMGTWDLSPDSPSRSGHGGWFLPRLPRSPSL